MVGDPQPNHVVVFDVNVYLDIARIFGPSVTWFSFLQRGRTIATTHLPSYDNRNFTDSLIAMFYATRRNFVGDEPMTVWTSNHIENMIQNKLVQAPGDVDERNSGGLGWTKDQARDFLANIHDELVWGPESNPRGGDLVQVKTPAGPRALGGEDGLVLRTAFDAGDAGDIKYCVTKDRRFRDIGDPSGEVAVLQPHQWAQMLRESSREAAGGLLRPGGKHRR